MRPPFLRLLAGTLSMACLFLLASCQTKQTADARGRFIATPEQIQAQNHASATQALFSRPIDR